MYLNAYYNMWFLNIMQGSVDVLNGFAWPIWTSTALVMAKKKTESQNGNLTPDHEKLGIDPTLVRASGV
jgi:hypothetical protein